MVAEQIAAEREQMQAHADQPLRQNSSARVVMDVLAGPNLRWKDNLIQGVAILVSTIIGAVVGAALVDERLGGLLVRAFAGLVIGLFVSGIILMVYRMFRH